jgi:hypothetical protein
MPLLLGQLVYTSFPIVGFRTLTSGQVPIGIQQAFIQEVVHQHWNSYNPPELEYRAAYLYQVAQEHSLFGWVYNDGLDDVGRSHVPYFICYYLAEQLHAVQLEAIFTYLHRGPLELIDRQSPPAALETVAVSNLRTLWSYQPARIGVTIPADVYERSHRALKQRRLLNLFVPVVPVTEQKMTIELNRHRNQQREALPVYTRHLVVEGIETDVANLKQEYQRGLQLYEQVLVDVAEYEYPLSDRTRIRLQLLQQTSGLKDEDIVSIEKRIAQQRGAVQLEQVTGSIKAQLTSHSKAITLVKLLNKAVAVTKAKTRLPAETKLPIILSTPRSLLIWGLVAIATLLAVALSIALLKSRQTLTSPSSDLQPLPSVALRPLGLVNQPAKPENQPQRQPTQEKQKDNEKYPAGFIGKSVPGFPTGTSESTIVAALGKPSRASEGYWPNTHTALYDLVPNQITVAYLFDYASRRVRQTEVSFAQSIDPQVVEATLSGMLDGRVDREIQQGLQQVRQRQSNQYSFTTGLRKGVIERNESDRIYIGVWEADLH